VNINDSLTIIAQAGASMGATIVKYFWAKDGVSFMDSTTVGEFRSVWSQSGTKVVRVKVVDSEGGISAPDSCSVTVTLDPPLVTHHNDTIVTSVRPLNFAITVHAVDINVSGHIVKYFWDTDGNGWKDSTTEPSYVIALTSGAPRKIRWAARDDDGIMVEDSFFINTNSPPSGLMLTTSDLKSSWANFEYSTGSGLLPINFSATDSNGASDISEFTLLIGQTATSLIKKYQGKSTFYLADLSASTNVYFRFVVRDKVGDSSFIAGSFITPPPPLTIPKITKSPRDTNITNNTSAMFTVTADGEELSYQWQKKSGSVWENVIGAYGATYTTMPMTLDLSGMSFRCVVSNAAGNATSTIAIVTVLTPCTATGSSVKMTLIGTGPHNVTVETNSDPGIKEGTIYRPTDLGGAEKYPIFVWGEGACAQDGLSNKASLAEIASWGYFIIADGSSSGGGGTAAAMLAYITWAIAQNRNPCSAYYQSLDTTKIAADGFSCGGQMALNGSADPRFTAIGITSSGLFTPDAGIYSKIHTPIKILLGGTADMAYANGMRDYENISALGKPVLLLSKKDAGHGGDLGNGTGDFNTVNLAWLNWQLKGDLGATGKGLLLGASCKYCTDSNWEVKSANLP
jgi:hypothetical protein